MPSPMRPMRASAHFTGMGLASTKSFWCSPMRRLFRAMAFFASPATAAAHISCIRRGATLAVTEMSPLAPSRM